MDEKESVNDVDYQRGIPRSKLEQQTKVSKNLRGKFKSLFDLIYKVFEGFDEKVLIILIPYSVRKHR